MEKYLNNDTISVIFSKLNYRFILLLVFYQKNVIKYLTNLGQIDYFLIRNYNKDKYNNRFTNKKLSTKEIILNLYKYNFNKLSLFYFDFNDINELCFKNLISVNLSYSKNINYDIIKSLFYNSPNIKKYYLLLHVLNYLKLKLIKYLILVI